jgi:L-ascorbate metabolism protein UlaG (beta-lactamase superfamily)
VTGNGYKGAGKLALVFLIAGVAMIMLNMNCASHSSPRRDFSKMSLWDMARSKVHHGQGHFINPFNPDIAHRSFVEILKWRFFSKNPFKPFYKDQKTIPVGIDWPGIISHHSLSITYITHAAVLIKENNTSLIVDPVLFGLFWPIKDYSPVSFSPGELPKIDAALITHGHYDHLDLKSLRLFNDQALFLCPLGYGELLKDNGSRRVRELDWLDTATVGPFEITFLPCNHWTMRNPIIGPNTALWGSYLVRTSSDRTIYISGDTAYFDKFREIGEHYRIDLAVFNLGAYEPRWFMKKSHMNPEEVVRAFREIGAKKLLVVHWGTFRLGDEPVNFPPMDIRREMEKAGLIDKLVELNHGQTLDLD